MRARRAVVMAASVTHSPMLLQRSGIRNKALGYHFRAHPGSGIFGAYEEEVHPNVGATQGWSSSRFRLDHGLKLETLGLPLELAPSRLSGGGALLMERLTEYPHLAMWILAVRAEALKAPGTALHERTEVRAVTREHTRGGGRWDRRAGGKDGGAATVTIAVAVAGS